MYVKLQRQKKNSEALIRTGMVQRLDMFHFRQRICRKNFPTSAQFYKSN